MREKKIRQLIKILEETGIAELEVRKWWGERIRIAKNGTVQKRNVQEIKDESVVQIPPQPESLPVQEQELSYHVVTSPMVGTFYRAPAPGEAPFVSVGDSVRTGQTLCIIEAMKVMNEIEAEVNGTVVKIQIENAQPVEYNLPLFYIDESS